MTLGVNIEVFSKVERAEWSKGYFRLARQDERLKLDARPECP